jgi:hypothetical protein
MRTIAQTPYEVYCDRCRVTFPVGTRRCVHCGDRIAARRPQRRALPVEALGLPRIEEQPEEILVEEEPMLRRSGIFSPTTLLWIVLGLGVALQRACAG